MTTTKLTAVQRKARNLRRTAGAVFYVAAATTAAANVYASQRTWIGVAIGLWVPLAFFMSLELIERIEDKDARVRWARRGAIGALALIAGWESYWHLVEVFTEAGADQVGRYAMPFTVDILMVIARSAMKVKASPSRPSVRRKASPSNVRQIRSKKSA